VNHTGLIGTKKPSYAERIARDDCANPVFVSRSVLLLLAMPASADQIHCDGDDGQDQQDIDQPTHCELGEHTEKPQDEENNGNSP
jgi:hypothetical protein